MLTSSDFKYRLLFVEENLGSRGSPTHFERDTLREHRWFPVTSGQKKGSLRLSYQAKNYRLADDAWNWCHGVCTLLEILASYISNGSANYLAL